MKIRLSAGITGLILIFVLIGFGTVQDLIPVLQKASSAPESTQSVTRQSTQQQRVSVQIPQQFLNLTSLTDQLSLPGADYYITEQGYVFNTPAMRSS